MAWYINIDSQLKFHRAHGKLATVTSVQPPGRYGALLVDGDEVNAFAEKPAGDGGRINGGFFVLSPKVLQYIEGDNTSWETEPLVRLAKERQLMAYSHSGYWQAMDTLRDKNHLEELWTGGSAPWKVW